MGWGELWAGSALLAVPRPLPLKGHTGLLCHHELSLEMSCKSEHPTAVVGKGSSSSCLNPARICCEEVAELPPQRCPCALPGDTCVTRGSCYCPPQLPGPPPLQQEQAGTAAFPSEIMKFALLGDQGDLFF